MRSGLAQNRLRLLPARADAADLLAHQHEPTTLLLDDVLT